MQIDNADEEIITTIIEAVPTLDNFMELDEGTVTDALFKVNNGLHNVVFANDIQTLLAIDDAFDVSEKNISNRQTSLC